MEIIGRKATVNIVILAILLFDKSAQRTVGNKM